MKAKKLGISVLSMLVLLCLLILPVLALTGTVATNSDPLRMRTGPGTGYDLLYQDGKEVKLPKGSAVSVLGTYQSDKGNTTDYPTWYKISATFNGKTVTGFVASKYIALDPETTDPPVSGDVDIYAVPELYRPYLKGLMEKHPNWQFLFVDTGLDWNDVMDHECYRGKPFLNVVSPSSNSAYRYKDANGNYLKSNEGWYQASDEVVAFYMDPRNSMSEERIFQFELQSFDGKLQTIAGVESILAGSFMANKKITADDGRSITYAEAIYEAGQKAGASPYFLAAKIIQEVSRNGSGSTSGKYIAKDGTDMSGYYNFYNIQATSATNDPIKQGLQYASQSGDCGRPWTSPYKSIVGGAQWIARSYINVGQNTNYLQKFDVDSSDGKLYWHQYMTNVAGAYSESKIIFNGYVSNGIIQNDFVFAIPTYKNLPTQRCRLPGDTSVDPAPIPDPEPVPSVTDIAIATQPTKTVYEQGEAFSALGLSLKVSYSNNTTKIITGGFQVSTPDMQSLGTKTVTVTYAEKTVSFTITVKEPSEKALGDVNGDGKINSMDARIVLQAASGARELSESERTAADVNGDGEVNSMDARRILIVASGAA